jgi:hypothetical protein
MLGQRQHCRARLSSCIAVAPELPVFLGRPREKNARNSPYGFDIMYTINEGLSVECADRRRLIAIVPGAPGNNASVITVFWPGRSAMKPLKTGPRVPSSAHFSRASPPKSLEGCEIGDQGPLKKCQLVPDRATLWRKVASQFAASRKRPHGMLASTQSLPTGSGAAETSEKILTRVKFTNGMDRRGLESAIRASNAMFRR